MRKADVTSSNYDYGTQSTSQIDSNVAGSLQQYYDNQGSMDCLRIPTNSPTRLAPHRCLLTRTRIFSQLQPDPFLKLNEDCTAVREIIFRIFRLLPS